MPLYSYKCPECERQEEFRLPFDHENPFCEEDHDEKVEMKRNYNKEGIAGIHFKGSGFHVNDYD